MQCRKKELRTSVRPIGKNTSWKMWTIYFRITYPNVYSSYTLNMSIGRKEKEIREGVAIRDKEKWNKSYHFELDSILSPLLLKLNQYKIS